MDNLINLCIRYNPPINSPLFGSYEPVKSFYHRVVIIRITVFT